MPDPLSFYATAGMITSLDGYHSLFDDLPTDLSALCRTVQGLQVHVFWAERYGLQLADERKEEVQRRFMTARLARLLELDEQPLSVARPLDRRIVGNCRDFSVTLAAMLRYQGVPARARCGFGAYFWPKHFEDHWVCEVWDAAQQRWRLVDAQLDTFQCDALKIAFDPLDVPRDQFITGGAAWQLCRSGQASPDDFGIFDMHGLWFVRGNLVRDVAALNKVELLPWDGWGLVEGRDENLTADDLAFLDRLADLTAGDVPQFAQMRDLYTGDARVRVPAAIQSYSGQGVQTVQLAAAGT